MSDFLSHFAQAKEVHKPWKCLGCVRRFKLKAHAANHVRQSKHVSCQRLGFENTDKKQSAERSNFSFNSDAEEEKEIVSVEESVHALELGEPVDMKDDSEVYDSMISGAGVNGDDIEEKSQSEEKEPEIVRRPRKSSQGKQHGRPYKISMVINRMEALLKSDRSISKKQACRVVSKEFGSTVSTVWRWCFSTSKEKIEEVHNQAKIHGVRTKLPTALQNMSKGHIRRADIGEAIDNEFVARRAKCLPVDFNWFRSRFNWPFRKANESTPSDLSIAAFLKRANISL